MGHLAVRSYYSLLNGTMSIDTILTKTKEMGMSYVGLCDVDVLYGALEFYQKAQASQIHPIFGMECTVMEASLILLAKNNDGFIALNRLSYLRSKNEVLTLESVASFKQDLIVIALVEGGHFEADSMIESNATLFNAHFDTWYLGLSHQESQYFKQKNHVVSQALKLSGVKPVALSKVYYETAEDEPLFKVLSAIRLGKMIQDRTLVSQPNRYFRSQEEMQQLFEQTTLAQADAIAEACNVTLDALTTSMPEFDSGKSVSNSVFMKALTQAGLKKRYGVITTPQQARLDYELSVIETMGFTDYFLIVYDIVRFAKQQGIYVGPGRGSAAGSLVAYCLGITDVDPLAYGLMFERFLNPERISMPDIDIDFPDTQRQVVVDYVVEKYGVMHAAHIITFGTLQAKQALRDVGRVFGLPTYTIDQASKMIKHESLQVMLTQHERFNRYVESHQNLKQVVEIALRIEGLPRHTSIHAAGIVMSSKPLLEVVALQHIDDAMPTIQYDMTRLESIGLIKIDLLGLRNLTVIDDIVKNITGFTIQSIPLDDKKTLEILGEGHTVGIFQLESEGMTSLLKQMKPNRFLDLVDAIALYRPGPMKNIPLYLKHRQAQTYEVLHESMRPIVKDTYGVLIYQEQIMEVAQVMAGFSLAKADVLRRAMSKKDRSVLKTMHESFVSGCVSQGYTMALAESLFDLVLRFAEYGFNKSHSVAYALIAYQMAYLKAHYPCEFYTALLNSTQGSASKTHTYLLEAKRAGIEIVGPDIRFPFTHYSHDKLRICLPLSIVKGVRAQTVGKIAHAVQSMTQQTYFEAVSRCMLHGVQLPQLESLIDAGAFDVYSNSRAAMKSALEQASIYMQIIKVNSEERITFNYDLMNEPTLPSFEDVKTKRLKYEFESLGFYLSDHPAALLRQKHHTQATQDVKADETMVRVIAELTKVKHHRAKNGKQMAFITLKDDTGDIDGVVFPNTFEKVKDVLIPGSMVVVKGKSKELGSLLIEECARFE